MDSNILAAMAAPSQKRPCFCTSPSPLTTERFKVAAVDRMQVDVSQSARKTCIWCLSTP